MNDEKCPICGADAKKFLSTGDFHGFDCPTHGQFEVSETTMSIRAWNASQSLLERSLVGCLILQGLCGGPRRGRGLKGTGSKPAFLDRRSPIVSLIVRSGRRTASTERPILPALLDDPRPMRSGIFA